MHINDMTRKQFEKLPHRDNWNEEVVCTGIVVLPAEINIISKLKYDIQNYLSKCFKWIAKPEIYSVSGMHDSGFRLMNFVATKDGEPICLVSGCSDVLHLDGIGGFGYKWYENHGSVPNKVPPSGWSIDCLPKSGLLHFWTHAELICGEALSSFELYSKNK